MREKNDLFRALFPSGKSHTWNSFILHHFSISLDEQRSIMGMYKFNNSLHKTCMMYRIVYTKLSYSLLSQCGISINPDILLDGEGKQPSRAFFIAEYT